MHLCRYSSKVPRLPSFLKMLPDPHVLLTFCKVQHPVRLPHKTTVECPKVLRATRACTFSTSQLRKVVQTWCAFHILTFKFASRHGRALFQRLNFQECSERGVLCTFWLQNDSKCASRHNGVNFLTSELPEVFRERCVLDLLTSKCASRHNGVQFLIPHPAKRLRTRRFSGPTFRPSGATKHWKKLSVSRLFYLFAHFDLLSSDSLFSDSFFL